MVVEKKRNHENKFCVTLPMYIYFIGEMAEWFKAADCKSVEFFHRRFESCSLQNRSIA